MIVYATAHSLMYKIVVTTLLQRRSMSMQCRLRSREIKEKWEIKWNCTDFKCVRTPTQNWLSLTRYAINKSRCWADEQNKNVRNIGVARGCSGCTCTPQGGEKNFFRRNLQGNCVSAPQDTKCTPSQSRSQFLGQFFSVFAGQVIFGCIF